MISSDPKAGMASQAGEIFCAFRFPPTRKGHQIRLLDVGPPLTLTHRLQISSASVTGYGHSVKCLLVIWPSRVALTGPMGCFDDSDQLARNYFTSRTHKTLPETRSCNLTGAVAGY